MQSHHANIVPKKVLNLARCDMNPHPLEALRREHTAADAPCASAQDRANLHAQALSNELGWRGRHEDCGRAHSTLISNVRTICIRARGVLLCVYGDSGMMGAPVEAPIPLQRMHRTKTRGKRVERNGAVICIERLAG